MEFLATHARGDWGELSADDVAENEFSLQNGFRLLSGYATASGQKLWVFTEAELKPSEICLECGSEPRNLSRSMMAFPPFDRSLTEVPPRNPTVRFNVLLAGARLYLGR
jgi:hypothetical protein